MTTPIKLSTYDGTPAPRTPTEAGDQAIRALELTGEEISDKLRAATACKAQYAHNLARAEGQKKFWQDRLWFWKDAAGSTSVAQLTESQIETLAYYRREYATAKKAVTQWRAKVATAEQLIAEVETYVPMAAE